MSRRVFAHMVVRDEQHRYLQAALTALAVHVDAIHVHDDGSSDESVALALDMGAIVTERTPTVPAFADSESRFRQDAWEAMRGACRPCPGDWVLAIDADELLVAPEGLWPAITAAAGRLSVRLLIPEVFAFHDGVPMIRVDGFWGGLSAPRLVRYLEWGTFRPQKLACGSVPTYAVHDYCGCGPYLGEERAQLLHLGYADPTDREDKYRRYAGRPGHSSAHVGSILTEPRLRAWEGPPVEVWRGVR